ncbi:hypothetical protein [Selenomonas ruminantium]|uniref:Uncharacterized protein n=1 Tax=Selenomonas ruminantium TaxID=971 RepID=A0A1I0YBP1_SELRU|nr:hypothetical protein [Selenomonas ruminantium]SFB10734.1 hypothetical protein SAMN05216587_11194 [Selenomonas ruminantium]
MNILEITLGYIILVLLCILWICHNLAYDYQMENHRLKVEIRRIKSEEVKNVPSERRIWVSEQA